MSEDCNKTTIEAFPQKVSLTEAEATIKNTDDEIETAQVYRDVYYPYEIFTFQIHVPMLLHTNDDTVYCGVDLVNRNELLIDSNPVHETKAISPNRILPREYNHDAVMETARTYIHDLVNQQLKPLRAPTIECVTSRLLHRLFYIIEIETTDKNTLQYAVDSVLGEYHRIYLPSESDDME
jgi:hypothetical protein